MTLLLTLTGCGPDVELGTVSGVVTQAGEPLSTIMVSFLPDPGNPQQGTMSSAITDSQGRYELIYQDASQRKGAVPGIHHVVLNDLAPENYRGPDQPPATRVQSQWMDASRTPFHFEVKRGQQKFDIILDN